jgi:hypothetical protein
MGRNVFESVAELEAAAAAQESLPGPMGRVLDMAVSRSDALAARPRGRCCLCAPFEGNRPCPLPPSEYLQRILFYTKCSPALCVIALVYLQRLKDSGHHRLPALTSFNIQRMLLTSMMIAHKFLDEPVSPNAQWALVGDISVKELNRLELKMLWALQFSLKVSHAEYLNCRAALEAADQSASASGSATSAPRSAAPTSAISISA